MIFKRNLPRNITFRFQISTQSRKNFHFPTLGSSRKEVGYMQGKFYRLQIKIKLNEKFHESQPSSFRAISKRGTIIKINAKLLHKVSIILNSNDQLTYGKKMVADIQRAISNQIVFL